MGRLTGRTTHGTPHPYDIHVPVLFYGAGVRPGQTMMTRRQSTSRPRSRASRASPSRLRPAACSSPGWHRRQIDALSFSFQHSTLEGKRSAPSVDRLLSFRVADFPMPGSRTLTALLVAGLAAAPSARATLSAQAPDHPAPSSATPGPVATRLPHAVVAAATSADAVGAWTTRISSMLRDGRLDIGRVDEDTMLPGRTHERLVQRFNGLPVFGAEVVRQLSGSTVETIFGTVTTMCRHRRRPRLPRSRLLQPRPRR